MIPINTFNHPPSTKIILAGDQYLFVNSSKQLGPIIHSYVAKNLGLGVSLSERLMTYCAFDTPGYPYKVVKWHNPRSGRSDFEKFSAGTQLFSIKLLRNFRSQHAILKIPNQLFYKSELQVCADQDVTNRFLNWEKLTNHTKPILFINTIGKDEREGKLSFN